MLSLALGFSIAIIIVSYVYQEYTYDNQLEHSDRIYRIFHEDRNTGNVHGNTYSPLAQSLVTVFPEIEDAVQTCYYYGYLPLSTNHARFNEKNTVFVNPGFFRFFSFEIIEGDRATCLESPNSIVLSKTAANKYFGSENALGKFVKLNNDKLFTVTAIFKDFPANSNFHGDVILPLQVISNLTQIWIEPSWKYESDVNVFIKLKPDADYISLKQKIAPYLDNFVAENTKLTRLQAISDIHTSSDIHWEGRSRTNETYLVLLVWVAFILLLLSGANFIILYAGKTAQKITGTGVKKIFGASRANIFREHAMEILFYLITGCLMSVLLFLFYNNYLATQFSFLPEIVAWSTQLFIILGLIVISVALLIGLYPLIKISTKKSIQLLNPTYQSVHGKLKLANILVIAQFSMCILLIGMAILLQKQLYFLKKYDPGFEKDKLITIPLNMHIGSGIYNGQFDVFAQELKKQSGIENVTMAFSSPANVQTSEEIIRWEGQPVGKSLSVQWNAVFFDYFKTLGITITQGRTFSREYPQDVADYHNHSSSFVLNEQAVKQMELDQPIGTELEIAGKKGPVIGVVENFHFKSLHSDVKPMCFDINPYYLNEIIVHTNGNFKQATTGIKEVWQQFVPDYPVEINFIEEQIENLYKKEQNLSNSISVFSGLAIFIAAMGLFGSTILSMQKRIREIGIRKVNGAKTNEILQWLNTRFIKQIIIAIIISAPVLWFLMNKWLQNFAYKTTMSWWIFALAGFTVLFIALFTVSWQSWRAASRNPVEALRYE